MRHTIFRKTARNRVTTTRANNARSGSRASGGAPADSEDSSTGADAVIGVGGEAVGSAVDADGFRQVTIEDRNRFEELFKRVKPRVSELTFTNMIMWRKHVNSSFRWSGDFLIVRANPGRFPPFAYAPIGDSQDRAGYVSAVAAACGSAADEARFRCVPEYELARLTEALRELGREPRSEPDRDFFDYVYASDDLANLRGKKYDGKRNHISRFKRERAFAYEPLEERHIDECARLLRERCERVGCGCLRGEPYACDRAPTMEVLSHIGELGCRGAVVTVDGRLEAFTVGEALNDDTAVIYIEKANAAITGLYAFINQQFVLREWSDKKYINREEDEGVEGLRKAKMSYHPAFMSEKYAVNA